MNQNKKYNKIKIFLSVSKTIISLLLILVFVVSGLSNALVIKLGVYIDSPLIQFVAFVFILSISMGIILFPISFYTSYTLEHKYNLSNQSLSAWFTEEVKAIGVGLTILLPILLFFYYSLNSFEHLWWLPFAIFLFLVSVVLAKILPTYIFPLFYKITPINNNELVDKISGLTQNTNLKIENIYAFDMSKNTKKANAAFTGLGKTKRIILGDTLLDNFTVNEILTVVAHELGHYKKKHIPINIAIGTVMSFLTLYLAASLYAVSIPLFGFVSIKDIAALPVLLIILTLVSIFTAPLSNAISRKFEFQADEYAVLSTNMRGEFISALEKLNNQNLSDKDPHPFVEWFFYSHPSIKNRVNRIRSLIPN